MVVPPFNFQAWVEENRHLLKPPVGNTCLLRTDGYFVMVVGGPNERSDFHYQSTEELFYQVQGTMYLRIVEDGQFKSVEIKEGEMFLLPDELHWFCPNGDAHKEPYRIRHATFASAELFVELPRLLTEWAETPALRVCQGCGREADALASPVCPPM